MVISATDLSQMTVQLTDGGSAGVRDVVFAEGAWEVHHIVADLHGSRGRQALAIQPAVLEESDIEAGRLATTASRGVLCLAATLESNLPVSALRASPSEMFRWGRRWGVGVPAPGWPATLPDVKWAKERFGKDGTRGMLRSFSVIKGYRVVAQDVSEAVLSDLLLDTAAWKVTHFLAGSKSNDFLPVPAADVMFIDWSLRLLRVRSLNAVSSR